MPGERLGTKAAPTRTPTPSVCYIEHLYLKRFGKPCADADMSIEELGDGPLTVKPLQDYHRDLGERGEG